MEQTVSKTNPLGLEPLCRMFGATEQSVQYCLDYGRPIILGFTFLAIYMAFTPIIRATDEQI